MPLVKLHHCFNRIFFLPPQGWNYQRNKTKNRLHVKHGILTQKKATYFTFVEHINQDHNYQKLKKYYGHKKKSKISTKHSSSRMEHLVLGLYQNVSIQAEVKIFSRKTLKEFFVVCIIECSICTDDDFL